ncbi:MAG: class II aldolase/adducin family protein [Treponema sp.]|jgi:ribulose-5-phosphate 4-epimerase/fuculose-1-phosphate aldolase|nr:class II aldolase/adducin family protein [Treponema sp.]
MKFEKEREEVRRAGMKLDRYGLIALSGGNVSVRMPTGEFLVTPSGMIYEDMVPADVLVMTGGGDVIEGERSPSVDTEALLYIFNKMPHINAVIHTHQPYATAVGLVADELPCIVTTLPNAAKGPVKVCPFSSAASLDMGVQTVENCGDTLAVILKCHGVMALGTSLKEALYSCVYLEEAAKTFVYAHSMSDKVACLTPTQVKQAVEIFRYYGQGKTAMPEGLTKTAR